MNSYILCFKIENLFLITSSTLLLSQYKSVFEWWNREKKSLKKASVNINYSVKFSSSSQSITMKIASSWCLMNQEKNIYILLASLKEYDSHSKAKSKKLIFHKFFNFSKFTNLTIQITNEKFKVHKLIVCDQFEWFSCMSDREWKMRLHWFIITLDSSDTVVESQKTIENVVAFKNDDFNVIEVMICFMYEFDYDSSRERVSSMLFNVRVYEIAEKYRISQLKQRVKAKFENIMRTWWDMNDFSLVIRQIYTSTIFANRELRNVIVETANNHIKSLLWKNDILFVLEQCERFSADVFQFLTRDSTSTTKYDCLNCVARWEEELLKENRFYYCLNCEYYQSNWTEYAVK